MVAISTRDRARRGRSVKLLRVPSVVQDCYQSNADKSLNCTQGHSAAMLELRPTSFVHRWSVP